MPKDEERREAELIDEIFTYHPPDDEQRIAYENIRSSAKEMAHTLMNYCPPSEDRNAALRQLRDCVMTANASVALKGLV
jgi:hypothetical protein